MYMFFFTVIDLITPLLQAEDLFVQDMHYRRSASSTHPALKIKNACFLTLQLES